MSAPVAKSRPPIPSEPLPRPSFPLRNRILFLILAWLLVLMPFFFWRGTWFGRPLSEQQIGEYLHDKTNARHTQHALVQIGERMARHDAAVVHWYPELVALAASPVEEIRNTDAWVMGQDPTRPEFHQALLNMLNDDSPLVRGNAALALVRFGDASGRAQIVAMLEPAKAVAPSAGQVQDMAPAGTAVHQHGTVAKLKTAGGVVEVRSPIAGRVRGGEVQSGETVAAGRELATMDPSSEQVWEALRALYLIGQLEDLPAISRYKRSTADMPQRIADQAAWTEKAIRERAAK